MQTIVSVLIVIKKYKTMVNEMNQVSGANMNPIFIKSENNINGCLVLTSGYSVFGLGGSEIALYVSNWHTLQGQDQVIYWETEWDNIFDWAVDDKNFK